MRNTWLGILFVLEAMLLLSISALALWLAAAAVIGGGEPLSSWTGRLA